MLYGATKATSKEGKLPKSGKYLALLHKTVSKSSEINRFRSAKLGPKDYMCLLFGRRKIQTFEKYIEYSNTFPLIFLNSKNK
jgi:hypothetical protein